VYKTHITDLDLSAMPLMNGCHDDDVMLLCPLHSYSLLHFVQITSYFVKVLSSKRHIYDSDVPPTDYYKQAKCL